MFSLFGCSNPLGVKGSNGLGKRARPNESDLVGFYYSYDGTIGGNNYSYQIYKGVFTYEAMDNNYGELSTEIDDELLVQLKELYLKHKVYQWDGFSKYAEYVDDGDSFSLSFSFAEGESCSAHGSNVYPDGFRDFEGDMEALLGPVVSKLKDEAREKIIAQGLPGKVDSCMADFKQQGASGSDYYSLFVYKTDRADSNNFSIRIKSVSGEYYDPEEVYVYGHLDEEYIDPSWLDELLEKYDIITWYDYDEAAENYNDCEWFQMALGFESEENSRLDAMGTKHPENYDEFRDGFIKGMISFYEEVKDKVK